MASFAFIQDKQAHSITLETRVLQVMALPVTSSLLATFRWAPGLCPDFCIMIDVLWPDQLTFRISSSVLTNVHLITKTRNNSSLLDLLWLMATVSWPIQVASSGRLIWWPIVDAKNAKDDATWIGRDTVAINHSKSRRLELFLVFVISDSWMIHNIHNYNVHLTFPKVQVKVSSSWRALYSFYKCHLPVTSLFSPCQCICSSLQRLNHSHLQILSVHGNHQLVWVVCTTYFQGRQQDHQ